MSFGHLFTKTNKVISEHKLFFFHHAGGNVAHFLSLFNSLDISIEFHIINLPGRGMESKGNSYTDFNTLMQDIQTALVFKPNDKIYLLGHSMGSLFVYALVKYIEKELPGQLVSFGISGLKAPGLRFRKNKISHLPESEFLKSIELVQAIPEVVKKQPAVLSSIVETLRNDFKIIESFPASDDYFSNRSLGYLFGGHKDTLVSEDDLAEWFEKLNFHQGPTLFPGDHFFIFNHLKTLIQTLRK
ncbi:MAG: thioesterase [Deltaproteobacteria bacterium]|nr:thioesterase [Deltaproteobacteria bacterium]